MKRRIPISLQRSRASRPKAHVLRLGKHGFSRNTKLSRFREVDFRWLPVRWKFRGLPFSRSYFLIFLDRIFMRRGSKSKRRFRTSTGFHRTSTGLLTLGALLGLAFSVIGTAFLGCRVHRMSGGTSASGECLRDGHGCYFGRYARRYETRNEFGYHAATPYGKISTWQKSSTPSAFSISILRHAESSGVMPRVTR